MRNYEVTFSDGIGARGRILVLNADCNIVKINELASKYYAPFCRVNKVKLVDIREITKEQMHRYSREYQVDNFNSNKTIYLQKSLEYAERYGVLDYKTKGNYMIYNQNYYNKEFIGGKWKSNPCTYQRRINLDNGVEETKKLQRLQKNGWKNV